MPVATPSQDASYASDQKQVKLLAERTISYEDYGTFIKSATASAPATSAALMSDTGTPPESADTAEHADAGDSQEGAEDVKAEEPAPVTLELVDGRPLVSQVPEHPGGLTGEVIDKARAAAEADARARLIQAVLAFQINPVTTVGDLLGADASEVKLDMPSALIVQMTWLDAKRLEVEVQVPVNDFIVELQTKFNQADFSPLKGLDQNKFFMAKGVGKV